MYNLYDKKNSSKNIIEILVPNSELKNLKQIVIKKGKTLYLFKPAKNK